MGFIKDTTPVIFNVYSEPQQKFKLAGQGLGKHIPPKTHMDRIKKYFDPLPIWYETLEQEPENKENGFIIHAITQRPAAMYHSWGSQNAWLRQIHGSNRLFIPKLLANQLSVNDGDWVYVSSRKGKIKVRVKIMLGLNNKTVWTWNAIGKRSGSWNLQSNVEEASEGFLLNHLIDDSLPRNKHNYSFSNSDPITGQAAWFDVRVKIEKITNTQEDTLSVSEPNFDKLILPPKMPVRPNIIGYNVNTETE